MSNGLMGTNGAHGVNGMNGTSHTPEVEVLSMAANYPEGRVYPEEFERFRKRHYPDTEV